MGGPPPDPIVAPLPFVRRLFSLANQDVTRGPAGGENWGVAEALDRILVNEGKLLQVPELNSSQRHLISPGQLVRFRGMVQDMFNVEYYVGAYKEGDRWHTTKYCDVTDTPISSDAETQIWERHPFYCVPVPGESVWFRRMMEGSPENISEKENDPKETGKRQREEPMEAEPMEISGGQNIPEQPKRLREVVDDTSASEWQNLSGDLNFPLGQSPLSPSLSPCIVKVYDSKEWDLKINDIVEFVGIFSFDPEVPAGEKDKNDDIMDEFFLEDPMASFSASKVPRLHCMWMRKFSTKDYFGVPLLPEQEKLMSLPPSAFEGEGERGRGRESERERESLLSYLRAVVGGDDVAAQCLLLHLLSRVHTRRELLPLGNFSLNLTNLGHNSKVKENLASLLSLLLPRCHTFPLSLSFLNSARFLPFKDYSKERLISGPLQLPAATHVTVDETKLETGQLSEIGSKNLFDLKNLMESQMVQYDLQYYKMDMNTDIPILVISNAKSRILPTNIVVPLQTKADSVLLEKDKSVLNAFRLYLNSARSMDHRFSPEIQSILESDLVAARQEDRTLGPEHFHRWLTMARLMSASYGEEQLTVERWRSARSLDSLCQARLRPKKS